MIYPIKLTSLPLIADIEQDKLIKAYNLGVVPETASQIVSDKARKKKNNSEIAKVKSENIRKLHKHTKQTMHNAMVIFF